MARTLQSVPDMAEILTAERDRNGYSKKLYKAASDEHKSETLQQDILLRVSSLQAMEERGKVDFSNLAEVRSRTYDYLNACAAAAVYPSVMGLAVHGYGISRQALNQYLLRNNNETAEFIRIAKDIMADILTNASLYNNANAVQALFQLKNHFGHADRVEIEAIPAQQQEYISTEELERKYAALPND